MNRKSTLLALVLLVIFAISTSTFGQQTHTITLYVDTGNISNQDTNSFCNFGQDESIPNEEFTISVSNLDMVVWQGQSTSSENDEVMITSINHQGGKNVFDRNVLRDTQDNPGVVTGQVVEGIAGDEQKYSVNFKVTNNGSNRNGTFHIDPKIKVTN